MLNKGLGFICLGHEGWIFFLDKDTKKVVFVKNMGRAEYLPKRVVRLKKKFPLKQSIREELIKKIRKEYSLLTQKT